jgi:hypothetical protein
LYHWFGRFAFWNWRTAQLKESIKELAKEASGLDGKGNQRKDQNLHEPKNKGANNHPRPCGYARGTVYHWPAILANNLVAADETTKKVAEEMKSAREQKKRWQTIWKGWEKEEISRMEALDTQLTLPCVPMG